jgi:hypothetical protein
MTEPMEKKEKKPQYETPVVVRLDQVDKAAGAGTPCLTGSAVLDCLTGSNATSTCFTGGAGVVP